MKVLVISDLHANWHALDAVLSDCRGQYDEIVCCGDLVGYNAQPEIVIEWTRRYAKAVIRGNHDKAVAGIDDLTWFNDVAQVAARWTAERLGQTDLEYLKALPRGLVTVDGFQMCHGSPQDEDEYVTSAFEAARCFPHLTLPVTFFGHTHLQGGFFLTKGRIGTIAPVRPDRTERVIEIEPDLVYLVNPGSVGQPRDGDPRAGYAILHTEEKTITLRRTKYDVSKAASSIRSAGLPDALAARLFQGS